MSEPPSNKTAALVDRLVEQTTAGKVHWSMQGEANFAANLRSGTAVVRSKDGDGLAPYVFEVLSPEGVVVSGLETMLRQDETPPPYWVSQLTKLYALARELSAGANEVLDGLLGELDDA
jgi:hypothetical protein